MHLDNSKVLNRASRSQIEKRRVIPCANQFTFMDQPLGKHSRLFMPSQTATDVLEAPFSDYVINVARLQ